MLAFPNVSGDCFALDEATLAKGFQASRESPRNRIILPLHRSQAATVQRMLNFLQPSAYIQPHIHAHQGQIETIHILRGRLGFVHFDPNGEIRETHNLRSDGTGTIDIEHGVWHGMVCLEPDTAVLEIKQGPYDAKTDKAFANWAPAEGEDGCEAYRKTLESYFP